MILAVADGLGHRQVPVMQWPVPDTATTTTVREMADLARDGQVWAGGAPLVISLFTSGDLLDVTYPYVLEHTRPGTVWLQLGPHATRPADVLHAAARAAGTELVRAPMTWAECDGTVLYLPKPSRSAIQQARSQALEREHGELRDLLLRATGWLLRLPLAPSKPWNA
jgi:hypothetical protein